MHNAVGVHMDEALEEAGEDGLYFEGGEPTAGFDCVEQCFPLQKFQNNIDGILGLVDSFESEDV